jgi:Cft2 family RNA processing exonuclease
LGQNLLITGSANDIVKQINQAEYGAHYLLIYSELRMLREIYSRYVKTQLEKNNEIVLILPHHETADNVRKVLSEGFFGKVKANSNIDIRKYENEGSFIVIDSVKGHFGSDDLTTFVKRLSELAQSSGKNGVSMFTDGGSFFHLNKLQELIEHEMSMPSKFDINLKRFCMFHRQDFRILADEQKQKLVKHHGKGLMITINSDQGKN